MFVFGYLAAGKDILLRDSCLLRGLEALSVKKKTNKNVYASILGWLVRRLVSNACKPSLCLVFSFKLL